MHNGKLKWRVLRLLLRTVGRTSRGVALGYRRGFDSGPMLDYVYEDRARGTWPLGPLIDRLYLNAIGWRAIRARKELLKEVLREELAARRAAGQPTALLDVASGPARYLLELCQALRDAAPETWDAGLEVLCRDLDPAGLELGRLRAQRLALTRIRWEVGDACDPASLATVEPRPNLVVVSGLYELLDDGPIRASLRGIHDVLEPGGTLVFTTQVRHPQLELIANVLVDRDGDPWVMTCRSTATAEGWARDAGFTVVGSQLEPLGLFAVTLARKPAGGATP